MGKVSLGSVTLYVPLTLSQQAVLPHSPTYHMLSILCYENMKTLFLDAETHPCCYFEYFELEKHSYKMNTGLSCYPLRMYFFSKYLQWDVGRMVSSGQIINHPSASIGTKKDANSVWRRELLDAVRKHPQVIKTMKGRSNAKQDSPCMLGRQILSSEGCLNTWTDCHRAQRSPSLSIFIPRRDIFWQGNHSSARSFQAWSRRHWVGVIDLYYAGGQPRRVNGPFWLQSQRKYCDLIKHRKPTWAKAQLWKTAKSLQLGCKWSAQSFTCTIGNQKSWSQDPRITQVLSIIRIWAVSNQRKQIGWIWGRLCAPKESKT